MFTLRPVVLVTGALVAILGLTMLIPMLADLSSADDVHRADWASFAIGAIAAVFIGGGAAAASWGPIESLNVRQGFLLTGSSWLALVIFAAIPLSMGGLQLSYVDAFFEAMSGVTTTGSTVVSGLDDAPPGALLWRSMLQWFGGVGIIIMAFAVLPALKVGGMQIFKSEAWGHIRKICRQCCSILYVADADLCLLYRPLFSLLVGVWHAGLARPQPCDDNRSDRWFFNKGCFAAGVPDCGPGAARPGDHGFHDYRQPSIRHFSRRISAGRLAAPFYRQSNPVLPYNRCSVDAGHDVSGPFAI